MASHSFNTLMQRLSRAGFKRQFVKTALLPDWWEDSYSHDQELLPEIEIRVSRFLGVSLETIKDPNHPLRTPLYAGTQLRRVRNNVDRARMGPAIHAATRIGAAIVRNLKQQEGTQVPPADPSKWRQTLEAEGETSIQLGAILTDLWERRIPVIPLETLPSPTFQGMSCIVDDHPVIFLGHKYDEPGRVAFIVCHEVGHVAIGDCSTDAPVLHETDGVRDDSPTEKNADSFATRMLVGDNPRAFLEGEDVDAKILAQKAFDLEIQTGADASSLIYSWAARTLNYPTATMAVKALYRSSGAQNRLREFIVQYVDLDSVGDSDRSLLNCIYGEQQSPSVID